MAGLMPGLVGSLRGPTPNELQLWEVVGGVQAGGILVREGPELTSTPAPTRLSTGAIIREAEIKENRLRYRRLTGTGPLTGWINIKNSDKDLLIKTNERVQIPESAPPPPWMALPVEGRKLRILALHGRVTNANILKFQLAPLKKELGKQVEWLYLEAPMRWDTQEEYPDLAPSHPTELEQRLAKDQPLLRWFWIRGDSTDVRQTYWFVEDALTRLKEFIKEQEPIDLIVSFSQGSMITNILVAALQNEGLPIPWRMNVFFSGGWIRDPVHTFMEPCHIPTIQVTGGKSDPYFVDGEPSLEPYYPNLRRIDHADGHTFPTTQPRAQEIIKQVAEEVRKHTGFT